MHRFVCIAALFSTILGIGFAANAALAPVSREELMEMASHAMIGVATEVTKGGEKCNDSGTFCKQFYNVKLKLTEVLKGGFDIAVNDSVTVSYYKVSKRPDLWVGPGGLYGSVQSGDLIEVFTLFDGNTFSIINPNGMRQMTCSPLVRY